MLAARGHLIARGRQSFALQNVLTLTQALTSQVLLQSLQAYSDRAGDAKGTVEAEDVLTAIQARAAFSFVQPPPEDVSLPS